VSGVALHRRTKILAAVAIILLFAIGSGGLRGDVDHTFLTSLVDQSGILRVQYIGVRFNPDEMLRDLQGLLQEVK
jgi:hypothetical protein